MRSVVVALTGPSGSGKSTTAARLARRYGWAVVEEAYDRLSPRPDLTWATEEELGALELRLLDEEGRRFLEARSLSAEGRTVVADTSFLDPVGYTAGLAALGLAAPATFRTVVDRAQALCRRQRLGIPDLTVQLSVSRATRQARAAGDPLRHPEALRARHEEVGRRETAVIVPCLRAALPGRVRAVRAAAPAAMVVGRVRAMVARTIPLRDPCGAATRVLERLARSPVFRRAASSGNLKRRTPSPRPLR